VAGQTILIADDDQGLQNMLGFILKRAGYQVLTVTNGEDAVEAARTQKPDLVLMDIAMPIMDGLQATKHIRRLSEGRTLPIIFLTAADSVESTMNALRSGGNDYIIKPVRAGELVARIEAHLRPTAPAPGKLIMVYGSKAGAGVTTLTINLALALRQASQKEIIVIDWQRPLGDIALMLGIEAPSPLSRLLDKIHALDESTFMEALHEFSPGVWALPGASDLGIGQQMDSKAATYLTDLAVTKASYVIVDAGTYFGWNGPLLAHRDSGFNLCMLTPDIAAVQRAAQITAGLDPVEHRVWPILNRCDPSNEAARADIEAKLGTTLSACIPDVGNEMTLATNEHRPLYATGGSAAYVRAMDELSQHILTPA